MSTDTNDIDFTIRTDDVGDYIHFFDGRDNIRGDKAIIRYLYDYCLKSAQETNKAQQQLLTELLGELPEKQQVSNSVDGQNIGAVLQQAAQSTYNIAIDDVTSLIKGYMK